MNFSLAKSKFFDFLCIAAVGILVYSNTFHVPYYLDDLRCIVENSAIRDIGQTSRNLFSSSRGLVYLTFALNYWFGGLDVVGYHIVNLGIHIFTVCLVLLILKRIFRLSSWFPLLGALLFLVHPLQTQAVTYIVQRMTSLAGLFFFLSLYLYIRAREEHGKSEKVSLRHGLYYFAALLSGAIAVYVKQNAAILPLALLFFDYYFLPQGEGSFKKRLLYLLPFFLAPMWVSVQELLLPLAQGTGLGELARPQKLVSQRQLTAFNYLVTEFSVIWLYIRLLFLPYC